MKAAAAEYLRQQREAFDQNKAQAAQWFALRLRMAYTCLVLTVGIGGGCGSIIVWHEHFPNSAVAAEGDARRAGRGTWASIKP